MKATYINAHKFIKVSYMIHIVCFSAQCTVMGYLKLIIYEYIYNFIM